MPSPVVRSGLVALALILGASCAQTPNVARPSPASAPPSSTPVARIDGPPAVAGIVAPAPSALFSPPPPPAAPPRSYLSTKQFQSYVWEKPIYGSAQLGFFRAGAKVPRGEKPYEGKDQQPCLGTWYQVEPYGFVCVGRDGITLDLNDPGVVAASKYPPRDLPLPYGYGMSFGALMYARIPTPEEQKQVEGDVASWRAKQAEIRGKTEPAKRNPEVAIPVEPVPSFLENHAQAPAVLPWLAGNKTVRAGWAQFATRLAFVAAFESEGRKEDGTLGARAFYLTTEHQIIPADRVRAAATGTFQGVELAPRSDANGEHLPMVWSRIPGNQAQVFLYRLDADAVTKLDEKIPLQGHAGVKDGEVIVGNAKYYELRTMPAGITLPAGPRYLVKASEATYVAAATALEKDLGPDELWIQVSLYKQTLVMYRGTTPIFATLISSGSGGKGHTTPWGNFRVYQKHISSRMEAPEKPEKDGEPAEHAYRFDDVPYVQYIVGGIALHAAFWHASFGLPVSHGCINLSPQDAQYVFKKTLPAVPEGWHGVNPGKGPVPRGTMVVVRGN